jgi:hypothetical protein
LGKPRQGLPASPFSWQQSAEIVVRVDAGKTTEVHLDEPWSPPEGTSGNGLSARAGSDWRLGWSAHAGARLGLEGELRYVGSPLVAQVMNEAKGGSVAVGSPGGLADLMLGTAELAGVAGEVTAQPGVKCKVVGSDQLALIVRQDSPLGSAGDAELRGLVTGAASGASPAPFVMLGRGTGAESVVHNPRAVSVDPADLVKRVSLSSNIVGVTSQASAKGEAKVKVLPLPEGLKSPGVALSLCATEKNAKALAVLDWAGGDEGRALLEQHGIHTALEKSASR